MGNAGWVLIVGFAIVWSVASGAGDVIEKVAPIAEKLGEFAPAIGWSILGMILLFIAAIVTLAFSDNE